MNGATLAFRRRAMGIPKGNVAARLGVSKDTLADWEAGRVPVPDDAAKTVTEWWQKFVAQVQMGVDDTLALLGENDKATGETVIIRAYRTPEAYKEVRDDETLYEHSAHVVADMIALELRGLNVTAEWMEDVYG